MSKFIHLHTHSHYSLLQALPKIPELVSAAKDAGMNALALTDNGNLYGAIEFYQACKKAGIKPIIGVDAYVALRTRQDKQAGVDNRRTRLVLLAKSETGYKNLIQLVTRANIEGFYYRPRIDRELLKQNHNGLVCIMPAFNGELSGALKIHDTEKAKEIAHWYQEIFDRDLYLEITHHPEIEGHEALVKEIVEFGKAEKIPVVATNDVYYLSLNDRKARNTLLSIQNNGEVGERNAFGDDEPDLSFIKESLAEEFFKDFPEAVENTIKVAEKCNLELTLGTWYFPDMKIESGRTPDEELRHLVIEGLKTRKMEATEEVKKRYEYELEVIKNKGYSKYFLVVGDLLRFAHENKILTTIRGSVAGSLVTYLAGITNVNPLEYKIPFERFLNPERPSAPDIDMDYADNRRDEVIAYARKKYGEEHVAQIGTFGTMMARGSVRDVARALGFAYSEGDRLAKLIPMGAQGFPMTIDRALEDVPELKETYDKEADAKTIIDMAKKIEGCARHVGVHAAGVVIAPTPLTDYTPLQFDPKGEGKIITQYDMYSVGEDGVGLLKFDFLGIKNLSILASSVDLVEKILGQKIDIEHVPLNDKKTFEMLARGETIGLFQLNGSGLTKFLKDLRPSTILDINAMVALYRPGPLESIPRYIERKHNPLLIRYLDPRMKDILDQSYGVITYQDDVLLIAVKIGGYSWLEADKLRKAMGKKIPAEMEAQKEKLQSAFVKNGMSKEKAEELWKLIEPFAAYGFNKAHAASYGRVAYQTAYMKANFPAIYMAAVLTADAGDVEKIAEFIAECKRMGIPVLPPSINESFQDFTVVKKEEETNRVILDEIQEGSEHRDQAVVNTTARGAGGASDAEVRQNGTIGKDKIRFGLNTIKNFGEGIAKVIIEERKTNGQFKSLVDFLDRIKDKNLNKKSLEALIKCGAMDELGERGTMLGNLEDILTYNKEKNKIKNQDSLFGGIAGEHENLTLKSMPPAEQKDKLAWEKELLGLYVSGHPLDNFKEKLAGKISIQKIKETMKEGMMTVVSGIVEEVKPIQTKKGDQMAFIKLSDMSGTMEVVVFARTLAEFKAFLLPEACIAIKGKVSMRNGEFSLLSEAVKKL
ncbi:MAG: DNA polymerase III subunit alpha [Candidatus Pacebacteria bacterium]|nr:DNA polymerase III subunit alpha [Candidatus Paceibacterota bacterium]